MADYDADTIWSSSRTARQIHDPGRIEKVDSLALVPLQYNHITTHATTHTGHRPSPFPRKHLPEGDERSEQFVTKVGEYFETLDVHLPRIFFSFHITQPMSLTRIHHLPGNTNGPPLLTSTHPSCAHLTCSPYRPTSRILSSTTRCGAPLPPPSCVRPWLEWNWGRGEPFAGKRKNARIA
jgi:hypothetical protein